MRDDTYAMLQDVLTRPTRSSLEMLQLLTRIEYEEREHHRSIEPHNGRADPSAGGVVLDRLAMRVWVDGQEVVLTPTEMRLMTLLADHEGEFVAYEAMLNALGQGGRALDADRDRMRVHVGNLRRKVECNRRDLHRIVTVRGLGYRFDNTPRKPIK